jgi:glutathione S-transferase
LFDSNILAEHIELTGSGPRLLPEDRTAALRIRQLVILADGICDAGVAIFLERKRNVDIQNAEWIARQQGKILRALDMLEQRAASGPWLRGNEMSLADIAAGCTLFWLGLRVSDLHWQEGRPALTALFERLTSRPSFQQTSPPM